MAISLITALKLVPWAEVVSNAPLVVDGARKLWKTVGGKKPPDTGDSAEIRHALSPEAKTVAALESRVSSLEAGMAELQREMVSSAELIQALADQNARLVKALGFQRRLWLGLISILGIVAMVGVYRFWVN